MNNSLGVHVARNDLTHHCIALGGWTINYHDTLHMYRSHQGSCNGGLGDTHAVYTINRHSGGGCNGLLGLLFDTQEQSH